MICLTILRGCKAVTKLSIAVPDMQLHSKNDDDGEKADDLHFHAALSWS